MVLKVIMASVKPVLLQIQDLVVHEVVFDGEGGC